jgi:hypothetical protein
MKRSLWRYQVDGKLYRIDELKDNWVFFDRFGATTFIPKHGWIITYSPMEDFDFWCDL